MKTIQLTSGSLIVDEPSPVTPNQIYSFLQARDWSMQDDHWEHTFKHHYAMTWEQAMAIEFYEFITLGGR